MRPSARSLALASLALFVGCAVSENRSLLPLSAADAPKSFGPIAQCATSAGLRSQVSQQQDQIQIFRDQGATIVFRIDGGSYYQELTIVSTSDFSEADRQKKLQEAKPIADQIWACADAAMRNGGAPPMANAAPDSK